MVGRGVKTVVLVAGVVMVEGTTNRDVGVLTREGIVILVAGVLVMVLRIMLGVLDRVLT